MNKFLRLAALFLSVCVGLSAQEKPAQTSSKPAAKPAASQSTAPAEVIAIRGGKVLTITKGTIENGVVLIQGGKITAVGAAGSVNIPRGAKIVEAAGMWVYPGLIDSQSQLGLTEISAVDMTNDQVEPADPITPHMSITDAFHAETELIPVARLNGVTNAVVVPSTSNTLPGQMSMIQLDGRDRDEMLMKKDFAMPLNFTGGQRRQGTGGGLATRYPSTRMGVAAQLRQAFIDAQDYQQKLADYNAKPTDAKGEKKTPPKRDLKHEALIPYLKGEKPVLLTALEPSDLQVAMKLAKEFNLKVILGQVTYSQKMLDAIADSKLPVIVGNIYALPKANERYDAVFAMPAELQKRGVKIAFAAFRAHHVRDLPYAAGYAVAYGLPWEEAMKALTINPAEIWGVSDQLGSLEAGKTANVVVANGDPLDVKTDVKHVFIAGRQIPMKSRQTELRDAYMKK